jgi:hypothetical protein
MSKLSIKNGIIEVLKTVSVTGVPITVATSVPAGVQSYEGYVLYCYLSSGTTTRQGSGVFQSVSTWLVNIIGRRVGTGLRNNNEDDLLRVAEACEIAFMQNQRLKTAEGAIVNGVLKCEVGQGGMVAPSPYPVGQSQEEFYAYTFPIEVTSTWKIDC